jgi:hypothetical protein
MVRKSIRSAQPGYIERRSAAVLELSEVVSRSAVHLVAVVSAAVSGVSSLIYVKEKEADPALVQFDRTIRALHRFENIRYPDESDDETALLHVAWDTAHLVRVVSGPEHLLQIYQVAIPDVDRLVIEILIWSLEERARAMTR